ncbi:DNA-binding transcriptional MerR regulator [Paenibacillus eucommiae]|uniref:DNA-binding transcriptional MerR regulator n=1 Tax=Paenibacillus eucommiae TaxID=1355755 RepID=A0ABS4IQN3_9BACL|nr:DNA-binding transcriptional MerR regulator [Paenibacillus eucommiae]
MYGTKELERLQQILFYRELDFPLEQIKQLLEEEPERMSILLQQEKLLLIRKKRIEAVIQTLKTSIASMEKGVIMDKADMFIGFESEEAWKEALSEQNEYLKQAYDVRPLDAGPIDVQSMNEQAGEAAAFMTDMKSALQEGIKHNDEKIRHLIHCHLDFMNEHGQSVSAADFAVQTRFFLSDDFHLRMLEDQQTGLAYYLNAAAESFVNQ